MLPQDTPRHTRTISSKEKSIIRRSHWIILPVVLIATAVSYLVYNFLTTIPPIAMYGAYGISILIVLVVLGKQLTLERELATAKVEVINAILTKKKTLGTGKRINSSLSKGKGITRTQTYIITIDNQNLWVRRSTYLKAKEGQMTELVWLPKSGYVISLIQV